MLAEEMKHPRAQYLLGACYKNGIEVDIDEGKAKAVGWYRKAAGQGYADAQFSLGDCCSHGNGTAQDQGEAVYWYESCKTRSY